MHLISLSYHILVFAISFCFHGANVNINKPKTGELDILVMISNLSLVSINFYSSILTLKVLFTPMPRSIAALTIVSKMRVKDGD